MNEDRHDAMDERLIITEAARRLRESERGRAALESLRAWIDDHAAGLDGRNQDAVHALLVAGLNHPRLALDGIDNA